MISNDFNSLVRLNLRRFGAAARCNYATSQQKAHKHWALLQDLLSSAEVTKLGVAWFHATADEGPAELDDLIKTLTERYT